MEWAHKTFPSLPRSTILWRFQLMGSDIRYDYSHFAIEKSEKYYVFSIVSELDSFWHCLIQLDRKQWRQFVLFELPYLHSPVPSAQQYPGCSTISWDLRQTGNLQPTPCPHRSCFYIIILRNITCQMRLLNRKLAYHPTHPSHQIPEYRPIKQTLFQLTLDICPYQTGRMATLYNILSRICAFLKGGHIP